MAFTTDKLTAYNQNQKIEMTKFATLQEWMGENYREYLEKNEFPKPGYGFPDSNFVLEYFNVNDLSIEPDNVGMSYYNNMPWAIAMYDMTDNTIYINKKIISSYPDDVALSYIIHELVHFFIYSKINPSPGSILIINKKLNSIGFNYKINANIFSDAFNDSKYINIRNHKDIIGFDVVKMYRKMRQRVTNLHTEVRAFATQVLYLEGIGWSKDEIKGILNESLNDYINQKETNWYSPNGFYKKQFIKVKNNTIKNDGSKLTIADIYNVNKDKAKINKLISDNISKKKFNKK